MMSVTLPHSPPQKEKSFVDVRNIFMDVRKHQRPLQKNVKKDIHPRMAGSLTGAATGRAITEHAVK